MKEAGDVLKEIVKQGTLQVNDLKERFEKATPLDTSSSSSDVSGMKMSFSMVLLPQLSKANDMAVDNSIALVKESNAYIGIAIEAVNALENQVQALNIAEQTIQNARQNFEGVKTELTEAKGHLTDLQTNLEAAKRALDEAQRGALGNAEQIKELERNIITLTGKIDEAHQQAIINLGNAKQLADENRFSPAALVVGQAAGLVAGCLAAPVAGVALGIGAGAVVGGVVVYAIQDWLKPKAAEEAGQVALEPRTIDSARIADSFVLISNEMAVKTSPETGQSVDQLVGLVNELFPATGS